jgi:two-component system sensor histidine kinase ChvG
VKSLSSRLLLFNVLILFLPLGSLLFLDTYENQLLASQENSMIQQGRIMSSALTGRDLAGESRRILANLGRRVDARIRVVDARGRLLADSATLREGVENEPEESPGYAPSREYPASGEGVSPAGLAGAEEKTPNSLFLYRVAVYPVNVVKKLFLPPPAVFSAGEYYSGRQILLGPEILAALEGRYGAATRFSSGGQVSVNLYSAIPVPGENPETTAGAVLVSRSSSGILYNLYRLRLDIIKIFFVSLALSLLLSLVLSLTITAPIKKLKREAEGMLDPAGHFSGHIRGLKRKDEIGDLSRSLSALSLKLEKRITFIDSFTSDLLHELKNPLAAIRGQVELSLSSPIKEEKLLRGIEQEETRVERLLARLRELSRIDNALDREETEAVDLGRFIPLLLERYRREPPEIRFDNRAAGPAMVRANPDRLIQALTNPLDNARSFSPPHGSVRIILAREAGEIPLWRIAVEDQGPGIREESGDLFFERFYSERPQGDRENHSGLGLAIVRSIVQGYGGSCSLANRKGKGGCRFVMTLPEAEGLSGAGNRSCERSRS